MRTDLTDITVVMDRSGSMSICREEAESGINAFVADQRKQPGSATMSLVQFDTEYEEVFSGLPMDKVNQIHLVPRGSTALLDSLGRAIEAAGARLASLAEADRPGLVVFVVVTDGQENASHEFTLARIRQMITHQQDAYKWQFTFLGANQDAFAAAGAMGIPQNAVANYSGRRSDQAYRAASSNVARMRGAVAGGQSISNRYTADEQQEMLDTQNPPQVK